MFLGASAADARIDRDAGELVGVQYLRGIAAMMVLVYHLPVQLARLGYHGFWLPGLSTGVDIFYVISGLIMWVTTIGRPHDRPIDFWRRRLLRIAPLYWVVTAFVVAVMLLAPSALQSSRFDAGHVAASFFFVGYPHPVTHQIEPVVIPGWTLNHEMFFYLLFGLFLLAPPRLRLAGMVTVLALLVAADRAIGFPPHGVADFYTSDRLLEFALGMVLGALASQGRGLTRFPILFGLALLGLGMLGIVCVADWLAAPRLLASGIPATMLVVGLLVIEAHRGLFGSALLHGLGNASYSIYLSHMITLSASSQFWRALSLPTAGGAIWLYVGFAVALSTLAGWLLYLFVEKPLSRRLHRPRRDHARLVTTG